MASSIWKGLVGAGLFALAHAAFSAAQRKSWARGMRFITDRVIRISGCSGTGLEGRGGRGGQLLSRLIEEGGIEVR